MNMRTELFDVTMRMENFNASSNWGSYSFMLEVVGIGEREGLNRIIIFMKNYECPD